MVQSLLLICVAGALAPLSTHADDHAHHHHPTAPAQPEAQAAPVTATPAATAPAPASHLMLHGSVFGGRTWATGPRGRDAFWSTQMLMAEAERSLSGRHTLGLNLMTTFEKWTLPEEGYPLLLQTGESDRHGRPYIDAQHPHSSPIMGLTFSDTLRLGPGAPGSPGSASSPSSDEEEDFVRISFAPRGESTEGPVAFMHRPTASLNPDAPLGHHIGQDVGHITSTVFAAALRLGRDELELSTFNGAEPEPDEVNLPLGGPNSYAGRYTRFFTPRLFAMASVSYVSEPHSGGHGTVHPEDPAVYDASITHLVRYGASAYLKTDCGSWSLDHAWIYGAVRSFGVDALRHSVAYEAVARTGASGLFARAEALQRLPVELELTGVSDPLEGRWVEALTLGYSHRLSRLGPMELRLGGSGTRSFVPGAIEGAYGGDPWSAKLFLHLSGMQMLD